MKQRISLYPFRLALGIARHFVKDTRIKDVQHRVKCPKGRPHRAEATHIMREAILSRVSHCILEYWVIAIETKHR